MRIQNNITAMNTHRMYTINNDNVAKSAEKLSSGYRINRAGDDAAGLAISEKMRAQIRGLNMATKNSQDAISLVQTAEGALQETQNMLQRMNELAVQAATGTNQEIDRTALSKEFEQLKREINDVAEQTTFNNMKILDGSLSYTGYQRSAATAGVTNTVSIPEEGVAGAVSAEASGPMTALSETAAADNVKVGTAVAGKWSNSNTPANGDLSTALKAGETVEFKITVGDKVYTTGLTNRIGGTGTMADLITAIGNTGMDIKNADGDKIASLAANGNTFTITGKTTPVEEDRIEWTKGVKIEYTIHSDDTTREGKTGEIQNLTTATSGGSAATDTIPANTNDGYASKVLQFDLSATKVGDTIKVGDTTYEVVDGNDASAVDATTGKTASGNYGVKWNGKTDDTSDFVKNLGKAINGTDIAGTKAQYGGADALSSATVKGNTMIELKSDQQNEVVTTGGTANQWPADADLKKADAQVAVTYTAAGGADDADAVNGNAGRKDTIEFDVAKMKKNDTFDIKITDNTGEEKTVSIKYEGETRANFMQKVEKELTAQLGKDKDALAKVGIQVKGNAVTVSDGAAEVTLNESWKSEEYAGKTNAMRIQVGALENEQLAVSIDSMNTKGLGLDDAFLTLAGKSTDENIDLAGNAITLTRKAINQVSDTRATLGAMQNRLDHKIANLKVSSENLSAAESRIRDVDMASEMTNFTKNNILSQAATAMLAQANALPQNVLSLLG